MSIRYAGFERFRCHADEPLIIGAIFIVIATNFDADISMPIFSSAFLWLRRAPLRQASPISSPAAIFATLPISLQLILMPPLFSASPLSPHTILAFAAAAAGFTPITLSTFFFASHYAADDDAFIFAIAYAAAFITPFRDADFHFFAASSPFQPTLSPRLRRRCRSSTPPPPSRPLPPQR